MRNHWLVDILQYILGAFFNAALVIIAVYLVLTYAQRGYLWGEAYAQRMTEEKTSQETELVLEEETSRTEVARRLEEMGVIESRYFFELELFLKGSSKSYRAGTYVLDPAMSSTQINATLRKTPEAEVTYDQITIPEGYSIRDIAVYLEGRGFMTADEFIAACASFDSYFSFLYDVPDRPNRLEGYLFPDTYFVTQNPTPEEIIYKMLARFDEVCTYEYRGRAEELGLTLDEAVIIASLIEKEVRRADERAKVARVIYNRLQAPMRLQIDATVLFALDKAPERLTHEDLEVDSPYNTYANDGLPIGPIGNPGADCLRAALYPEDGRFLYYVVSDPETGEHYFSLTLEEHQRAVERYRQLLEE